MSTPGGTIDVLLVRSAQWLVGLDAALVERVANEGGVDAAVDLSAVLSDGPAGARTHPRWLETRRSGTILVDTALGIISVEFAALRPLPPTLRSWGVPDWWLGVTWLDGELVLLVDLTAAARAGRESGAS